MKLSLKSTDYCKLNSLIILEMFLFLNSFQECIAEHRDWRKCQNEVKKFKECMAEHTKQQDSRH